MSGGGIKVNYGSLESIVAQIRASVQELDDTLHQMEQRMEARKADWSGEDSDAYDVAREGWNQAMAQMRAILNDIGGGVQKSSTWFQDTEQGNKKRFQSL